VLSLRTTFSSLPVMECSLVTVMCWDCAMGRGTTELVRCRALSAKSM
jgi:hypothetical protein